MTKVVISSLASDTRKLAKKKPSTVVEKRFRDKGGKVAVLRTIDAAAPTVTEDLTYVFGRNVADARRDNKRLFGNADRVP